MKEARKKTEAAFAKLIANGGIYRESHPPPPPFPTGWRGVLIRRGGKLGRTAAKKPGTVLLVLLGIVLLAVMAGLLLARKVRRSRRSLGVTAHTD